MCAEVASPRRPRGGRDRSHPPPSTVRDPPVPAADDPRRRPDARSWPPGLADARRDQLRLRLVSDAAQASRPVRLWDRRRRAGASGSPPPARGPPRSWPRSTRSTPRLDPRAGPRARADRPVRRVAARSRRARGHRVRRPVFHRHRRRRRIGDGAGAPAGRLALLRGSVSLRRAGDPVPQARPDRGRRPGAGRGGAVRRHRPADDVRRQPRPPRAPARRRPAILTGAGEPDRSGRADRPRVAGGGGDPGVRGARGRAARSPPAPGPARPRWIRRCGSAGNSRGTRHHRATARAARPTER